MEEEQASQVGRSLIKQLACCKKTTREKTLRLLLKSWLPSQSQPLSNDDAKKLWKGLFYCMWHSDKPLVQADLVDRLSSLLLSLHLPLAVQYFSIFLLTMRREWSGIDALRLDKFYLLIRRFVSKFFSLLKTNSWDLQLVESLMGVFDEGTFSAQENKAHGNGVNYHIATVFLEELRSFLPLKQQVLEVLLKPFISALGRVHDKVLVGKIRSGVFGLLLKNGKALLGVKKSGDEIADSSDEVVVLGTVALTMGFSGRLYEMGSSAECWQGNRKVLFALHSEFLKLEKEAVNSGVQILIPDVVDEEEVPELVPLGPAEVVGNGEVLKKCEKVKEVNVNGGESTERRRRKKKKGDTSDLAGAAQSGKENVASENGDNANDGNAMMFSETVIANLQKQFEKVAEETGLDEEAASVSESPEVVSATSKTVSKKRKRTKSLKGKASQDSADLNGVVGKESAVAKSGEKSAKKASL
ncbi:ribosomal RNA processing protein 1 homolog isoform X2 [Vigna umbellata]|uniref:ribosomal RNA processing protein 1 homolog isoform X2 n=1 Tax=Vigna umbellata TaxID=87088 RepID=UPI001F5EF679|nr:ribosomal RNA processing protein 1 homolog isoform X2 [Vigna umbellata]